MYTITLTLAELALVREGLEHTLECTVDNFSGEDDETTLIEQLSLLLPKINGVDAQGNPLFT